MTRDEFAWLIVRGIGAFFLLYIALDLITLILISVKALVLHNSIMSESVDQDKVAEMAFHYGQYIRQIWSTGADILLTGIFAYYCFYRGAWIHGLLTSRLPPTQKS